MAGIGGERYNLSLSTEDLPLEPLDQPIPVEYVALEGKQVGTQQSQGYLEQLSAKTALLHIKDDVPLALLTNLKLAITAHQAPEAVTQSDIYAKVQQTGGRDKHYIITFTSRSPVVISWMNQQVANVPKPAL